MTLATDFAAFNIRPAVLFDLELDSGEINFWSGPYPIEAGGKTYLALPGIDGGISIQQSLQIEDLSGDIQLSGSTPRVLAVGERGTAARAGQVRSSRSAALEVMPSQ